MNNLPLFIWSNREISSRCFPIPFNVWIPDNTSLDIVIQKKVKTIQQANEFVTFHWDQTFFFLRTKLNLSVFTNCRDLDVNTFVSYLTQKYSVYFEVIIDLAQHVQYY